MADNELKDDGGPAFPRAAFESDNIIDEGRVGMSLRDWFAGQALAGFIANKNRPETIDIDDASWCFAIADAMIVVRNRR